MFAELGHLDPGQCPERAAFVSDLDPRRLGIGKPAHTAQEAGSIGYEAGARPTRLESVWRSRPPESITA